MLSRIDANRYQLIRDGYDPGALHASAQQALARGYEVIPPPHCNNVGADGRCRGHHIPLVPFDEFDPKIDPSPEEVACHILRTLRIPREVPRDADPLAFWRSVWQWRCSGGRA